MDLWMRKYTSDSYDTNGGLAKSGIINKKLLSAFLKAGFSTFI